MSAAFTLRRRVSMQLAGVDRYADRGKETHKGGEFRGRDI